MRRVLFTAGAVVVSMILWPAASRGAGAGAPAATVSISRVSAAPAVAEATRAVLRARERELLACYRQELSDDREPTTRVNLSWTLRANGSIATPKAEFPDPRADDAGFAFLACLKERAAGWRFREPVAGAPVDVGLTFTRQGGPAPKTAAAPPLPSSAEAISKFIQDHNDEIRSCYEPELEQYPGLEGKVALKWIIQEDGSASDVRVQDADTTLPSRKVLECMVSRVRGLRFPRPSDGTIMVVTHPWNLRVASEPADAP